MHIISTLQFDVYSDNLSKIPIEAPKTRVINTISPNSYGISTKDNEFSCALKTSDYLVLDGVYFALASILLQRKNIKRNQGPDVFAHFMHRLNIEKGRAFFLGSNEETLFKIIEKAAIEYPYISIGTYSPPFKTQFSDDDNSKMVKAINQFKPNIVFVGMTCPKQEKWAIQNRDKINQSLIICIGNVFDWFAGTQKAIHPFWFKIRLGWLIRIFLRPEVFKRNLSNQMIFFRDVILLFFKLKKQSI